MKRVFVCLAVMLLSSGCASNSSSGAADGSSIAGLVDLTSTGRVQADDEVESGGGSVSAFVPWDSKAVLAVAVAGEHPGIAAGSLIVRYGKSWSLDDGEVLRIYVLERAGSAVEPLSLEWQPRSGKDLRAVARVDGELRVYEFDR